MTPPIHGAKVVRESLESTPPARAMTSAEFRILRDKLGLTAAWVADQLDVTPRAVRDWDSGATRVPAAAADCLRGFDAATDDFINQVVAAVNADPRPSDLIVYRDTESLTEQWPTVGYPAAWHRAAIGRAAAITGHESSTKRASTMTEPRTLLLQLVGPTQAWDGQRARLSGDIARRASRDRVAGRPTATGIAGLLGVALGRPRTPGSPRLANPALADLYELDMLVRVDQPGQTRQEFRTTRRQGPTGELIQPMVESVLDDAAFLVGVSGDRKLLDSIETALAHPTYALYLGKREYPPSRPVLIGGIDQPLQDAVRGHEWIAGNWWKITQPALLEVELYTPRPRRRHDDHTTRHTPVTVDNPDGITPQRRDWLAPLIHAGG